MHRALTTALIATGLAVIVLVGALAPSARAQSTSDALQASIEPGFDGYAVPGRAVPVRVTLSASQLATGEMVVQAGRGVSEVVELEITGGSAEEHWVLLEAPPALPALAPVRAEARLGDRIVDLGDAPVRWEPRTQLLGTFAQLGGADVDDFDVRVGDQEVHVVTLEPALLDLGPHALAALDSVAATPDEIAGLPPARRDALLGWLGLGGTLYVDAVPGPLADWPEALQPVAPTVRSGAATVIATNGALAEGRWTDVVVSAPSRSVLTDGIVAQSLPSPMPGGELFGVDLGRDLPALSGLLALLAVYTILVGPVAYVVFRRRVMGRWVAIPVLAVATTGALFVWGDGGGADTAASVVDVIETGPGPAMATTRVLMATDRGDQSVVAPAGWTARQDEMFGLGVNISQRRGIDDVEIDVPAPAGGVGVLSAHGPVDFAGALEVTASAVSDGTVTGTVRNTTEVALEEVALFAGRNSSTLIGELGPGQQTDFELTDTNTYTFGQDVFSEAWAGPEAFARQGAFTGPATTNAFGGQQFPGDDQLFIGGDSDGVSCDEFGNCFPVGVGACDGPDCEGAVARPGALAAALRDRGVNVTAPGVITAVGWATDRAPVVDLGSGVDVVESRTAIVSRAVPDVPGDRLVDAASVRRALPALSEFGGQLVAAFAFDLPAEVGGRPVDPTRLRMHLPSTYGRVEIFTPDGVELVRDVDFGGGGFGGGGFPGGGGPGGGLTAGEEEVTVPPEAVVNGQVLYRVTVIPIPPAPGPDVAIYEAGP